MPDNHDLPPGRLLLVDDEPNVLSSLCRLLRGEGYAIRTASGGGEALGMLEQEPADVIISDMRMPAMSGAELFKHIRDRWPGSGRILLTGFSEVAATIAAVNEGGIHAYLNKPWDDAQLRQAVRGAVERKQLLDERNALLELTARQNQELTFLNEGLEDAVRARTAELKQSSNFLELSNQKLKESFLSTLNVFSNLLELRHESQSDHGKRVASLARKIARHMGLREQMINDITMAGLLHDIGKIGWTDDMITKPFNVDYSVEERQLAVKHPMLAEKLLMQLDSMQGAARIIRHHHERFDGLGYPDRLAGLDIPIGARILALADDYDELQMGVQTQSRRSPDEAAKMIRDGRGIRYDPALVQVFLTVMGKVEADKRAGPEHQVSSSDLKPGARLSRDLIGSDGAMLLSKGYKLDEKLIEQVRRHESKFGHVLEIWISLD